MSSPESVLVLAGGLSYERDVSLQSGQEVLNALNGANIKAKQADITTDLINELQTNPPDIVFLMLHGGVGEDGSVPEVLDLLGVPYVGSPGEVARICYDKSITTPMLRSAGIPTPRQVALPQEIFRELGAGPLVTALVQAVGLPLVVKPASGGSSLGVSVVTRGEDVPQAMAVAYGYCPLVVVEEYIDGTEVAATFIDTMEGPELLPLVAIRPVSGDYDFTARYTAGTTSFTAPADISDTQSEQVIDIARRTHQILGLRGISRIDLMVGEQGPVVIDANVAPGMTQTSIAPIALSAANKTMTEACMELMEATMSQPSTDSSDVAS